MRNQTILCISNRAWDSMWGESQKIMSRMARENRVLFFEPGRSVNRPIISEFRKNWFNFFQVKARRLCENLIIVPGPPEIPIGRQHLPRSILRKTVPLTVIFNAQNVARHVRRTIAEFAVRNPILWLYSPYHCELPGKFGEKLSCYHNYDEFPDFITNTRIKNLVQQYDNLLTSRVHVVFTTSRAQLNRRKVVNFNTYFVPNGVDFELFNRSVDPNLPVPEDIAKLPRPIIGFAGMLSDHIDIALLIKVAEAYPDYSLVLVGPDYLPDSSERQRLNNLSNVYFLGFRELNRLPNYLKGFDAALIPYKLEGHVLSGYPQKLHEYLAAGKSVVATAMPELLPYNQKIRIAKTHDEFVIMIREALVDYSKTRIQERITVARENTWDHRIDEMYRILEDQMASKIGEAISK